MNLHKGKKKANIIQSLRDQRLFLLILLLAVVGGCAYGDIKPEAVKEYRYFDEYKGFFPIEQVSPVEYNLPRIRADWVLPVIAPDGMLDYTPPSTREEAEQRVKNAADREKTLHPILTFPIGLALSSILLPVGEYYAHREPEKVNQEQLRQLEQFAGIEINFFVTDASGTGISGARILELVSPKEVPVFANQEGVRSFAQPTFYSYPIEKRTVELTALHLPIFLGTIEEFHGQLGHKDTTFNQTVNRFGKGSYTSLAAGRFAHYLEREKKWSWARNPTPLTMHFFVWAPGFKPFIHSVSNINPGDKLNLTAILEQLPNRARIEKILNEYETTLKLIPKAVKPETFNTIDKSLRSKITQTLEDWINDETLPSYLRWNAYDLFGRVATVLSPEIQEKAKSLTPCLAESPTNPWRLQGRYENFIYSRFTRLEAGKESIGYRYRALTPTPQIVGEAVDLLSKFEVIDPKIPELDNLRVVITFAKGDKERALSLSRYLNHYHFFTLFYGLNVIGARY